MENPVRTVIQATDHLTMAGLATFLDTAPEITVLPEAQRPRADVVVVAAARLTADVLASLRRAARETPAPVVLVLDDLTGLDVLMVAECRAVAVLSRAAVTREQVLRSVLAAAGGGGVIPPEMVTQLLEHVRRLRESLTAPPTGLLTPREIDVLRLIADGMGTAEIATALSYSERTVKKVFYNLTARLHLKNRPHAVAYALRQGVL